MAETPQWRREVQASRMPRGGSGMLPLELTAVAPEIGFIKGKASTVDEYYSIPYTKLIIHFSTTLAY